MEIVANSALIEKEPKCHVDKGFDNSESTCVLLLERGIQEMVLKYYAFWGLTFVQKNPVQMIRFWRKPLFIYSSSQIKWSMQEQKEMTHAAIKRLWLCFRRGQQWLWVMAVSQKADFLTYNDFVAKPVQCCVEEN